MQKQRRVFASLSGTSDFNPSALLPSGALQELLAACGAGPGVLTEADGGGDGDEVMVAAWVDYARFYALMKRLKAAAPDAFAGLLDRSARQTRNTKL